MLHEYGNAAQNIPTTNLIVSWFKLATRISWFLSFQLLFVGLTEGLCIRDIAYQFGRFCLLRTTTLTTMSWKRNKHSKDQPVTRMCIKQVGTKFKYLSSMYFHMLHPVSYKDLTYPPVCDDGVFFVITTLFPSFDSRSTL